MRTFVLSLVVLAVVPIPLMAQAPTTTVAVDPAAQEFQINRNIYGQFAEHLGRLIYGGIWVGPESDIPNVRGLRKDVLEALKQLHIPVLRWPGGCFADEYHWMDGIGPRASRPKMINTNWGGVTEDNSFGTHEFLDLCAQLGCEPYITGNLGSGSVKEMSQWVEYVNSDNVSPMTDLRRQNGREKAWGVKYWGVGNESWGCGGRMTPEYYVNEAKRYGNFLRTYGNNRLFRIACGPNDSNYEWTDVLMKEMGTSLDGLSLHYYAFANARTAADFDEAGWFDIMKKSFLMEELVTKHSAIMDKYDPYNRVALCVDEWGTWYKVEPGTNPGFLYQQNTLRDALTAGMNLNIFNNHADRVQMANIAQVVNVLQAMILTDGKRMVLTPTYHVFAMFTVHQDAMMVPVTLKSRTYTYNGQDLPAVNCSASIDSLGVLHLSLCNIDPNSSARVTVRLDHFAPSRVTGQVLTAEKMNALNSFDSPETVRPAIFKGAALAGNTVNVEMPPKSVVVLAVNGEMKLEPKPAVTIKSPEQGLKYSYYEITDATMPVFASLTPKRTGSVDGVAFPKGIRDTYFGIVYDGFIKIPVRGLYEFSTTSDDGTILLVDGKVIVNNDGRHAALERSGFAQLESGFHPFKVLFFQGGGDLEISASIKGPGMPKQVIPPSMFVHEQ